MSLRLRVDRIQGDNPIRSCGGAQDTERDDPRQSGAHGLLFIARPTVVKAPASPDILQMVMRFGCVAAAVFLALGLVVAAHDRGLSITWNREISRIVYDRCASCHRPGGSAFSLMTYVDAQPRTDAIKESVLSRRMPPWGAVKGFGNFRNDEGLTQEQIELITRWGDAGARRGNNPRMLPKLPTFETPEPFNVPGEWASAAWA